MTEDEYWEVAHKIMESVEEALDKAFVTYSYPCEDAPPGRVQFKHCFHKPLFLEPE